MKIKTVQYQLLPKQRQFIEACAKIPFVAYIGGFGSGKTHVLTIQSLIESTRPSRGLIGAPTYRMLEDTTQRKFFELCPESWIAEFSKSSNRVILKNGTEILFRSLETPERLTNLELDWFALDEIGEVKLNTYRMLQGRLRKPGGTHHGFCVGNPAGPTHWTYDYFVEKARQFPDTYHLVQATSYENTFISQDYVVEMEKSFGKDSLYFKRYVLGEFVAFEGAYWPTFDVRPYPQGHIVDSDRMLELLNGPLTTGKVIDFGYEHPFVCLWYVTDGHIIIFYDEYYKRHGLIREHCLEIRRRDAMHQARWNLPVHRYAITDHDAQGRAEIEFCTDEQGNRIGFPCVPAEKPVMESIFLVQTLITERRLFITERCPNARVEIPSYRAKPLEKSIREQPIKQHDDTCDCIRMACMAVFKRVPEVVRLAEPPRADPFEAPEQWADYEREFDEIARFAETEW